MAACQPLCNPQNHPAHIDFETNGQLQLLTSNDLSGAFQDDETDHSAVANRDLAPSVPIWDSELGIWKNNNIPWSSTAKEIPRPLWIFGYGSICWKPSFPFAERADALITGFIRRFWQQSTDHRGTPESPGLVMTLISKSDAESMDYRTFPTDDNVQGVAYRIPEDEIEGVVKDLDFREKGGYSRMITEITLKRKDGRSETVDGLVYVAKTDNPHFKYQAMEQCARIIAKSVGPSGKNTDYLYRLDRYLIDHDIEDQYIRTLAQMVRIVVGHLLTSKL